VYVLNFTVQDSATEKLHKQMNERVPVTDATNGFSPLRIPRALLSTILRRRTMFFKRSKILLTLLS